MKKAVLKNFETFTGMESLFNKVAGRKDFRPATLLKRDSNTAVFL